MRHVAVVVHIGRSSGEKESSLWIHATPCLKASERCPLPTPCHPRPRSEPSQHLPPPPPPMLVPRLPDMTLPPLSKYCTTHPSPLTVMLCQLHTCSLWRYNARCKECFWFFFSRTTLEHRGCSRRYGPSFSR